jgi:hypothetical protein
MIAVPFYKQRGKNIQQKNSGKPRNRLGHALVLSLATSELVVKSGSTKRFMGQAI